MQEQHIIGQGSYGCVFKPGFTCNGKDRKQTNLITKIQRKESTSENEKKISEKIKSIYFYSEYFAPILSSCSLSLAEINKNEMRKCEFIKEDIQEKEEENKKTTEIYESNKIKFIGKNSLQENIRDKYFRNSSFIPSYIFETYDHLLTALYKLSMNNILHFDIKENNIMCKDKTGVPIIIDFGLSKETNKIRSFEEIQHYSSPYYSPWPIDVAFMYFYYENPKQLLTKEFLEKTVEDFLIESDTIHILSKEEINQFQNTLTNYYQPFVGSSIQIVYEDSLKYVKTWDNYALTWTYLKILKTIFLEICQEENKMKKYRDFLVDILTKAPNQRPTPDKTQIELNITFRDIPVEEFTLLQTKLNTEKSMKKEKIETNVNQYTIYQLEKEEELLKSKKINKKNK
jgi:hypothetical protein